MTSIHINKAITIHLEAYKDNKIFNIQTETKRKIKLPINDFEKEKTSSHLEQIKPKTVTTIAVPIYAYGMASTLNLVRNIELAEISKKINVKPMKNEWTKSQINECTSSERIFKAVKIAFIITHTFLLR